MEWLLEWLLSWLIPLSELMGVSVVAATTLAAFVRYLRRRGDVERGLGRGLALGLEFKMAAEILKTVRVHQLEELVVLGITILLRALLSVLVHWELQSHCSSPPASPSPGAGKTRETPTPSP